MKAEICDIETIVTVNGQDQIIIPFQKFECGSSGCVEIKTESVGHKSISKTCMSLLKLDLLATSTESKVVDLEKCNSNYQTKFKNLDTNQLENISVGLKCSKSPKFVSPNGKNKNF
jgi:hypothetical protein